MVGKTSALVFSQIEDFLFLFCAGGCKQRAKQAVFLFENIFFLDDYTSKAASPGVWDD